ncbi:MULTISPECIES: hypothetical protein [unclassified Dysgonomonas]|uniref:hypothetical protein n=1 Tax=unclassified Dysgonomonas TaxID=2630389 RepID=UPI002104318C|nr:MULTISPECIES: hypothetical protein [unclassified Dysgonomonas]
MFSSCTYDYFEDETNYVVYVPKADAAKMTDTYKVEDVRIYIFNTDLQRERYSVNPFAENARSRVGNFHFKLLPGLHHVYCFTNMQNIGFSDIQSHNTARFGLQQSEDGYYQEPPVILVDYNEPHMRVPGPPITDTAWFEHQYVGRICFAMKNLGKVNPKLSFDNIKKVDIIASGVGTIQYLSQLSDSVQTRSSRNGIDDKMRLSAELYQSPYKDFEFGFENYYLPSPDLSAEGNSSDAFSFKISFMDAGNNIIETLNVDAVDSKTGKAVVLHMAQTIVLTIDGNNVQILELGNPHDWYSDIEGTDNNTPGNGGIEM